MSASRKSSKRKRRTCPACGGGFLKGRRAVIASRTGSRQALVCQPCASGGVTVVPDRSQDFEKCVLCETREALYCGPCLERAKKAAERSKADEDDDE